MGDGPGSQCRKELHEMDGEQGWILRKEREVRPGVPAMVQWVKNLTAVARVAAEVQVPSPAWCSGLKNLVLPQLCCRSQLQLGFDLWPGNFHMPWV